jgi:hypothetical protein
MVLVARPSHLVRLVKRSFVCSDPASALREQARPQKPRLLADRFQHGHRADRQHRLQGWPVCQERRTPGPTRSEHLSGGHHHLV